MGRLGISIPGPDVTIVQGSVDQPYKIPNYQVNGYKAPEMLPVTSWRSVGASYNAYFHESMLDEVAVKSGLDPFDMRLDLLDDEYSTKLLTELKSFSNWSSPLPEGTISGNGLLCFFWNSKRSGCGNSND